MLKMSKCIFATVKDSSHLPNHFIHPTRGLAETTKQAAEERLRAEFLHHLVDGLGTTSPEKRVLYVLTRGKSCFCVLVSSLPQKQYKASPPHRPDALKPLHVWECFRLVTHSFLGKKKKSQFPPGPKRRDLKVPDILTSPKLFTYWLHPIQVHKSGNPAGDLTVSYPKWLS